MHFAMASHLCFCGCGNKVVTPIRPTDWRLIFEKNCFASSFDWQLEVPLPIALLDHE
jgi:hypothetical protein